MSLQQAKLKAEYALDCIDSMQVLTQHNQERWEELRTAALDCLATVTELLSALEYTKPERYTPPVERPLCPHFCSTPSCMQPRDHEGPCDG